jgi:hypothetical protein
VQGKQAAHARGHRLCVKLISTELAQRPTRALIHTLIRGVQPHTGWWAPVAQHIYKEVGARGTCNEVGHSRQNSTVLTLDRSRGALPATGSPPSVLTAATATGQRRHGLSFVINTVARSSSSTKPLSLSLISIHDLGCLSKCKEYYPLDLLTGYDPTVLTLVPELGCF